MNRRPTRAGGMQGWDRRISESRIQDLHDLHAVPFRIFHIVIVLGLTAQ